jgi:ribonuclease P protein component
MTVAYVPGGDRVRVAYAIGRPVGSAVVRNRLRRRLRAAVRESVASDGGFPAGAYLVRPRPDAVLRSFAELRTDLGAAMTAAAARPPATGSGRP